MVKLRTMESVEEQLALGNKLDKFARRLVVDLATGSKEEVVECEVQRLYMPNPEVEAPYAAEAHEWITRCAPQMSTVVVLGRNGAVARIPYAQKDSLLPKVISALNA